MPSHRPSAPLGRVDEDGNITFLVGNSLLEGAPRYERDDKLERIWRERAMQQSIESYLNQIVCMDAMGFLRSLPNASVPSFLFSPPYNLGVSSGAGMKQYGHYAADAGMSDRGGSSKWKGADLANGYGDYDDAMPPAEYKAWQQDILGECWRCLPENGAIFYVHKPRIQNGVCITPLDFNPGHLVLRQIIIWARAGGFNWNPTYYCPTHEWVVVFAKPEFRLRDKGASVVGDVWRISQELNTWHPCPFPLALAERVLETTMPALVCDPFSGSGTTARAARRFGIDFIGCDRNAEYVERANIEVARERRMTLRQTRIMGTAEQESFAL